MVYVAVISLIQILQQLVQRRPHWISEETRKMAGSVLNSLEYFKNFLENISKSRQQCTKVEELEREIRTVVNEAEDVIELKITEIRELKIRKAKQARQTLSLLLRNIRAMKYDTVGSSFCTDVVEGYGDPINEDLQTGDALPGHSSRYAAKLNSENIYVGLKDDLKRIITRLKRPTPTLEIIPITGMARIGKTSLATMAYDDPEIRDHVEIHVWLTISQKEWKTIPYLLFGVLSCISDGIKTSINDESMGVVYKKLKGQRYFVVIDGIWNSSFWNIMSRTFPDDNNGSRIILISRLKDVFMQADPDSSPHEMRLLNADESWKLLHDKVFGIRQQVCPPELEDIGKQVAERCQGLPLALLLVAAQLSKVAITRESWEDVAKNLSKYVANKSDICLGVLAMSYNYLPDHFKPCFLYMRRFSEDTEVDIKSLKDLWFHEGFMWGELVGRDCLEDLVSRKLIMVRKRKCNGEWETCAVHDLVHDFILTEAEEMRRRGLHDLLREAKETKIVQFFHGLVSKQVSFPILQSFEKLLQLNALGISNETRRMVDSLLDNLELFLDFRETASKRRQHSGKIKELERNIRHAVNEAAAVIELRIYEIQQLEQAIETILPPLEEKIDALTRVVMGSCFGTNKVLRNGGIMNENLHLGQLSRQVANLNLEHVVVGLEDDLIKIKRRLTGPQST